MVDPVQTPVVRRLGDIHAQAFFKFALGVSKERSQDVLARMPSRPYARPKKGENGPHETTDRTQDTELKNPPALLLIIYDSL